MRLFLLKALIEDDSKLLHEAIVRLRDSTCCLKGDEQLWVIEQFEQISQAIRDHIQFEEYILFPGLEARYPHRSWRHDHQKLLELLEGAKEKLFTSDGIAFRNTVAELADEFRKHDERERAAAIRDRELGGMEQPGLSRILAHKERGFIG